MNVRTAIVTAVILAALPASVQAAQAKRVTGTVESIDAAKNELKLSRVNEKGQAEKITLKWKDTTPGAQTLETAKAGSSLSVEANDSMGAWEVTMVIADAQAQGQSSPTATQ